MVAITSTIDLDDINSNKMKELLENYEITDILNEIWYYLSASDLEGIEIELHENKEE